MPDRSEPVRVLVVDDDPYFVSLAKEWLASEPSLAFVGSASDGAEAVESVRTLLPDVVLIGGGVPGLGGLETATRIKATPSAPLVVVTSFSDADPVRRAAALAGADAFVPKTDLAEQLPALLAEVASARGARPRRREPAASRPSRSRPREDEPRG